MNLTEYHNLMRRSRRLSGVPENGPVEGRFGLSESEELARDGMKDQHVGTYGPDVQKILLEADCREALERVASSAMYGGHLTLMGHVLLPIRSTDEELRRMK